MTAKPVMAYFAEPSDIKELMQKLIEKAVNNGRPVSFFAAVAENQLQEMHLGKLIYRMLCETNGRNGHDWIVRQAPANRYFVLLSAGPEYLNDFAARLDDTFKMASLKVSTYKMDLPSNCTSAQVAEKVYSGLCQKMRPPVEDAVFMQA